jgi:hypothetical protein
LDAYTLYQDGNKYYRLVGNQLELNKEEWLDRLVGTTKYRIHYTDLVPYVIYLKRYYQNGVLKEQYYKYDGVKLIKLDDYSTKIHYGSTTLIDANGREYTKEIIFDVADKEVIYINELDNIPKKISIGSGVGAEIGL